MNGAVRDVGDAMGARLEQPDFWGSGSAAHHQPCAVPVSVWRRFRQRCEVGFRFASQLLDSGAGGSSQSRDTKMWAARARRTVCTIRHRKRSREIHIGQLSGRLPGWGPKHLSAASHGLSPPSRRQWLSQPLSKLGILCGSPAIFLSTRVLPAGPRSSSTMALVAALETRGPHRPASLPPKQCFTVRGASELLSSFRVFRSNTTISDRRMPNSNLRLFFTPQRDTGDPMAAERLTRDWVGTRFEPGQSLGPRTSCPASAAGRRPNSILCSRGRGAQSTPHLYSDSRHARDAK